MYLHTLLYNEHRLLDSHFCAYYMSMALCKTAVSPLIMHWRYCSLTPSHQYGVLPQKLHFAFCSECDLWCAGITFMFISGSKYLLLSHLRKAWHNRPLLKIFILIFVTNITSLKAWWFLNLWLVSFVQGKLMFYFSEPVGQFWWQNLF